MSTRYVWSRNNVNYDIGTKPITLSYTINVPEGTTWLNDRGSNSIGIYDKPTIENNRLVFPSTGRSERENYRQQLTASDMSKCYQGTYFLEVPGNHVAYDVPQYSSSSPEYEPSNRYGYFYINEPITLTAQLTSNQLIVTASPEAATLPFLQTIKGTANGTVSNSSAGAYPADGVSGNYWYTLSGSDNIDASAVGYNTQTPMGGQAITINVTPGTGNVYGGTVRYTYQVQLSGGSWQTIASNQTATSRSYTIPAGTTTFAARVRASDTWGFSSSTYTTGATISVTNNLPPTAPGSISVGSIVAGQAVTITLTAATDSDGTIASYIYERSIDGNGWTQIANVNALTYQDTVGQEWATVAYRAKAVDDDGASGPYVTSTTYTVNDGVLYISGPEVEMGTMVKPFTVNMSVGVTGNAATDVAFYVYVDGRCLHDTPVDTGESVPIAIDTRLLSTGDHIITATASKTGYVQASAAYHFETEIAALAGEGYVEQLRDYQGNPIFPRVVAAGIEGINTPTAATVTLTTSGWIQSGTRYAQTVTVEAVTVETAVVIADCALSDDADANASIIEAWGPVMSYPITQGSSTLTFYVDSVPSINIPVNVGVM